MIYNVINTTNIAIHHIWKLLREKILGLLHQKERSFYLFLSFRIYMRWWMLIQAIVVIISWYMCIKSLCSTSETYTVLYANYISIKVEEKEYINHMYMYFFFFMLYTIYIWCIMYIYTHVPNAYSTYDSKTNGQPFTSYKASHLWTLEKHTK